MSIRIILADDHTIVRDGLTQLIQNEPDMEVVAQAPNGLAIVDMAREYEPDIIIMDVSMPELNGVEATRQIAHRYQKVRVLGLSMHSSKKFITEMFKAGASGYLLKDCASEELVEAIHAVVEGKKYLSPSITDIVIGNFVHNKADADEKSAFSVLTQREREVLQLLAEGKTTKQIGRCLHISPKTVEAHRLRVMNKLKMNSIAMLTKYAVQEGLTQPEP